MIDLEFKDHGIKFLFIAVKVDDPRRLLCDLETIFLILKLKNKRGNSKKIPSFSRHSIEIWVCIL
jgi:hypothetical protein